ncbi:MAG TPA: Hsp70 family protein, partial [Candidatus Micrarchaeota archaeon]|nr:Hsp70 family protein [Candidatus Micrarchaeota archaeon]
PPAPRGVPQIEVTFDIDSNGILHVSAKDLGTGKEQKMRITAPHKMDKSDIEKKMKDAEQFAEEDKKKREEVEMKNEAETLIYTSEKTLEDLKDKIPADKAQAVKDAVQAVKDNISKDGATLKPHLDKLRKTIQEVGTYIYQGQSGAGAQGQPGAKPDDFQGGNYGPGNQGGDGNGADPNVKDAKFEKKE